jgi:hypothetical protein
MRVHLQGNSTAGHFAAEVLTIGNRKAVVDPSIGLIRFSDNFCNIVDSIEAMKNNVFPNIQENDKDHKWLCERVIIAAKNHSVNATNP